MTSTASASSIPAPISVSTSQAWDNDGAGLWSTFVVQVGTPAQVSRVIVSTAGDETWVVLNPGCPASYGSNCAFNRGGIFNLDNSTSWANIALYELDLELNLGYTGNGQFGYDTVTLGYPNSGGTKLSNQIVAGLATPDFWLGQFGLDPAPSNFTTLNDPQPSFLWILRNQSMIPSTSWGYTAGASYRYDKVQGSLTLGGYDTSRFGSKNVTFNFYNDVSRRFLAELRTITYIPTGVSTTTTSTTLMSETLSMYIDSTIPYIYLPVEICDKFESAFGLVWNATNEIYTVSDTAHATLLSENPSITFTLANTAGQTLDIVLPYASFDLTASFPVLPNGTNSTTYFPLKRAANDTQFTLGRVFLQETYLIADYDRSQFILAPCVWPSTFTENIVAIPPPSANTTNTTVTITHKSSTSSTPIAAIIGGVVGGIVLILAASLAYWWFIYKPKHKKRAELEGSSSSPHDTEIGAAAGINVQDKPELDSNFSRNELSAYEEAEKKRLAQAEIAGTPILEHEMDSVAGIVNEADGEGTQVFEMPAREPVGSELHTPQRSPRQSPRFSEGLVSPRSQTHSGARSPLSVSSRDTSRGPSEGYFSRGRGREHETYYNP